MNMPMLLDALEEVGVENPIVCSNINKIGFRMCGGFEAYERALREKKFRAIAMSVFASGAIAPKEAIEWICQQPNIEAIVFGASSRATFATPGSWLIVTGQAQVCYPPLELAVLLFQLPQPPQFRRAEARDNSSSGYETWHG